jgi:hypothetical protein
MFRDSPSVPSSNVQTALDYQSTPRKIPEERKSRTRHGVGSLKSRKIPAYFLNYIELFTKT